MAQCTIGGSGGGRDDAYGRAAYDCDVLVIGGGIVGLSTAYALTRAAPGTRVTVLEKEPGPARHQTGRNSGVIHSGIYYRPGSLKARYAVRGAAEMVKFCAEHGIPHEVTGKLIVATEREELPRLHALVQRGRENGIAGAGAGPGPDRRVRAAGAGPGRDPRGARPASCDFSAVAGAAAPGGACGARTIRLRRRGSTAIDPPPAAAWRCGTADGLVVRAPGPGQLRRAALRPDRPAGRATTRGCGSCPSAASTTSWPAPELVRGPGLPGPRPGVPLPRRPPDPGHRRRRPRRPQRGARAGPRGLRLATRPAARARGRAGLAGLLADRRAATGGTGRARSTARCRSAPSPGRPAAAARASPRPICVPAPAGVRAQAVLRDGTLVDDFLIREAPRTVHVLNAPSPAATASLPIGREVAAAGAGTR